MRETGTGRRFAIARIWRGRTRRERADEFEAYNYEVGIKPLIEKAMGLQTFRKDRADETEFMTISYWESREAMSSFTGDDPARIHHLERDAEFLIELPKSVQNPRDPGEPRPHGRGFVTTCAERGRSVLIVLRPKSRRDSHATWISTRAGVGRCVRARPRTSADCSSGSCAPIRI